MVGSGCLKQQCTTMAITHPSHVLLLLPPLQTKFVFYCKIVLIKKILFAVFGLCSLPLNAQNDSLALLEIQSQADILYRTQKYDSALLVYQGLLKDYQSQSLADKVAETEVKLGNTYYRLNLPNESIGAFQRAEELFRKLYESHSIKLIRPYLGMGAAHHLLGDAIQSKQYQEKAYELTLTHYGADHVKTARSSANLGISEYQVGRYRRALEFYHRALPVLKKETPEGHETLSGLLVNIGIAYSELHDFEQAIKYLEQGIRMDIKLGGEDNYVLAFNYLDLGQIYHRIGNDSLATIYVLKSIPIARKFRFSEVEATCHHEMGKWAFESGVYDEAIRLAEKAIEIVTSGLGQSHHSLANFYMLMGDVQWKQDNRLKALENYEMAEDILRRAYGASHPKLTQIYLQKARLYLSEKDYRNAEQMNDEGFSIALMDTTHQKFSTRAYDLPALIQLYLIDAQIERGRFEINSDASHLEAALNQYRKIDTLADQLRRGFLDEDSKLFLQSELVSIHSEAIQVAILLYQTTGHRIYFEAALQFSEKSKAQVLGEILQAQQNSSIAGVPDELISREVNLKSELKYFQSKLINEPQDDLIRTKFDDLMHQHDSMVYQIQKHYPSYFDLKYDHHVTDLTSIQSSLGNDQAMLSYFQGDTCWTIFFITGDKFRLYQKRRQTIDSLLVQFRQSISSSAHPFSFEIAFSLYQLLIPPELVENRQIKSLTVIPDGLLGHIAFEALATDSRADRNSFLVNHLAIVYSNSATLYYNRLQQRSEVARTYVGFAPSYDVAHFDSTLHELPDLPYAQAEINYGSELFGGTLYHGARATERNFQNLGEKEVGILHLAMHALIEDARPEQSKLVFQNAHDTLFDGLLHIHEILNSKLSSQLAILSACNSGFGTMHKGEGFASMSRAFRYAGCPNIMMSLWKASDQPAFEVVSDFLKEVRSKKKLGEAVRGAKLNYLQQADPLQSHPAHWANLILLGNPDLRLMPSRPPSFYLLIGVVLVLGVLVYFFVTRS